MRPLNKAMLYVIEAVQRFKYLQVTLVSIDEETKKQPRDWYRLTKEFYESLDDGLMSHAGLRKSFNDFEKVLYFKITDEMKNTAFGKLQKFNFD